MVNGKRFMNGMPVERRTTVMDYVRCARTVKDTPVDGSLRTFGYTGGKSATSTPVEWNGISSVDRQSSASGHTVRGTVFCTVWRICLGRRIGRCNQGISRVLEYANRGSSCGSWRLADLNTTVVDLVRCAAFVILCLDWMVYFRLDMQAMGAWLSDVGWQI
jgi:hypothetical protein